MKRRPGTVRISAGLALALALGGTLRCTTSAPTAVSEGRPCVGLHPPSAVRLVPLEVPPTFAAARISAELPAEVVVNADGTVRAAAIRSNEFGILAPFAEETLKRGQFNPGSFENNAAAVRLPVRVPIGATPRQDGSHALPEVWLFVAAGQSREARWQLRDSVSQVTIVAHVPKLAAPGGSIIVITPDKQTRALLMVPPFDAPQDIRQTIAANKIFAAAGEYVLELRGSSTLATTHFTVAEDYRGAVINACEPIVLTRKTGPGN